MEPGTCDPARLALLNSRGAEQVEVDLPHLQYGVAVYAFTAPAEDGSNLGRYYEECYLQAQKVRTLILDDYRQAFRTVDVVCCPTTRTAAFRLGERTENPLEMYQSDVNTVCSSLAGLPAISVPCGLAGDRLPVGLQFTGPAFGEPMLFRAAGAYEEASGYRNMAAPVQAGGEVS